MDELGDKLEIKIGEIWNLLRSFGCVSFGESEIRIPDVEEYVPKSWLRMNYSSSKSEFGQPLVD